MSSKKRIVGFEIIRLLACLCVITYHYNIGVTKWFALPTDRIPSYILDINLGDVGVALFFILSGAALMLTYPNGIQSCKIFYKKRLNNLFPLYYIAFIAFTVIDFLKDKGMPRLTAEILLSAVGMDGYAYATQLTAGTFYKMGEWFFGCILFIYLFSPLLLRGVRKKPVWTGAIVTAIYAASLVVIPRLFPDLRVDWVFFVRFLDIYLGMVFVRYIVPLAKKKRLLLLASEVVVAAAAYFFRDLSNLTWRIAFCFVAFGLVYELSLGIKNVRASAILTQAASLTFPAFLVHHKLIYYCIEGFVLEELRWWNYGVLYGTVLLATFLCSLLLVKIWELICKWYRALPEKEAA